MLIYKPLQTILCDCHNQQKTGQVVIFEFLPENRIMFVISRSQKIKGETRIHNLTSQLRRNERLIQVWAAKHFFRTI